MGPVAVWPRLAPAPAPRASHSHSPLGLTLPPCSSDLVPGAPWAPIPVAPWAPSAMATERPLEAGEATSSLPARSRPAPATGAPRVAAPSTGGSRPPPSGPTRSRRAG
eukprot:5809020-Pyramimonas_sp.AAC.1